MKRRNLLISGVLLSTTLVAQEKPNIIIILADDLGWGDVGFHGSSIKTPFLDSLAKTGVELTKFYTAPISSPTRAGLLTGRYPNRFGFRTAVIPPWREDGLDTNEETLADILGRNGYQNRAIIGKWHLGHSKKEYYPLERGFTHFYGHLNGSIDYFTHKREGELDWHNDWESCYDKGYSTDLITTEAVKCIHEYKKDGPFFLYVAYNAPHTPLQAKESDIRAYCNNFDELSQNEKKKVRYSAMVTAMDRGIGKIIETLKKENIMDNTLFLFFSDNGAALQYAPGSSSGNLRGGKFTEWDGGVRVPAILYWKDAEKYYNNISLQLTGFVDVVPTIKDIIGDKSIPKFEFDGLSMFPILNGTKKEISRYIYLGCGSVVTTDYKLIRKGFNKRIETTKDILVSFRNDPYERVNSIDNNILIADSLTSISIKYDTIKPSVPEVAYDKGKKGFVPPKEWRVINK